MNWDAVGAIGEIIGALAVILTLLYVSIQLKQNSASTRAATYSKTTDGWHHFLQTQSIEDIELMIRLAQDHESLTTAEFYRGYYLSRTIFRRMEHDYYQYRAGTFDGNTRKAYLASFQLDTFNNAGIRAMWALQRDFVDPNFRDYMEPFVEEVARAPQTNLQKRFDQLMKEDNRHST